VIRWAGAGNTSRFMRPACGRDNRMGADRRQRAAWTIDDRDVG
jgi:hypothetical protein